jgi:hypothetical protein
LSRARACTRAREIIEEFRLGSIALPARPTVSRTRLIMPTSKLVWLGRHCRSRRRSYGIFCHVGVVWMARDPQPEETRTIPLRTGNRLCDNRETGIGHVSPQKASGTTVTVCRSPLYSRTRTVPVLRRRFSSWVFHREPAGPRASPFRDRGHQTPPPGSGRRTTHNNFAKTFGRDRAEQHPPSGAKRVDAEGPNLIDLGFDRSGVNGPLSHGLSRLTVCGRRVSLRF